MSYVHALRQTPTVNTHEPVYCKFSDIPNYASHPPKPLELCRAAAAKVGPVKVDAAQPVRGIWRIYVKSREARVSLLSKNISIRGQNILLYDKNPQVTHANSPDEKMERITIKDIPLSVDNSVIENFLKDRDGVELTSVIKYSKERTEEGTQTDYRNGDRYVFARHPIQPPLPRNLNIGSHRCRVYHETQEKRCRACKQEGHSFRDPMCLAYDPDVNIQPFKSFEMILSNMHECPDCPIYFEGDEFSCVEKIFQHKKAIDLEFGDLAEEIKNSRHGGAAKGIAKGIPREEADEWEADKGPAVMRKAIQARLQSCQHFRNALQDTGDKVLAEATGHPLWACGLPPDVAACTKQEYWTGQNLLGAILMEERESFRFWLESKDNEFQNYLDRVKEGLSSDDSDDDGDKTDAEDLFRDDATHRLFQDQDEDEEDTADDIEDIATEDPNLSVEILGSEEQIATSAHQEESNTEITTIDGEEASMTVENQNSITEAKNDDDIPQPSKVEVSSPRSPTPPPPPPPPIIKNAEKKNKSIPKQSTLDNFVTPETSVKRKASSSPDSKPPDKKPASEIPKPDEISPSLALELDSSFTTGDDPPSTKSSPGITGFFKSLW